MKGPGLDDTLQLEVHDLVVPVLTGIYSHETHLPQPLRISLTVDVDCPPAFAPDAPLGASKNYLDLKRAATSALPEGVHFTLIEGVADHIIETLMLQDRRVRRVKVKIVKLNVDENPHTAAKYGIQSIPTLMIFKGGQLASRQIGAAPKQKLEQWITTSV